MITIQSNIDVVAVRLIGKMEQIKQPDNLLRTIAENMRGELKFRIHTEGKNASNQEIGKYKNAYLKLRQRKYNRTADSKVVLSLTGQMENDFVVIPVAGGYGLGFNNPFNAKKAAWNENKFGKSAKIYALSEKEKSKVKLIIDEYINKIIA